MRQSRAGVPCSRQLTMLSRFMRVIVRGGPTVSVRPGAGGVGAGGLSRGFQSAAARGSLTDRIPPPGPGVGDGEGALRTVGPPWPRIGPSGEVRWVWGPEVGERLVFSPWPMIGSSGVLRCVVEPSPWAGWIPVRSPPRGGGGWFCPDWTTVRSSTCPPTFPGPDLLPLRARYRRCRRSSLRRELAISSASFLLTSSMASSTRPYRSPL